MSLMPQTGNREDRYESGEIKTNEDHLMNPMYCYLRARGSEILQDLLTTGANRQIRNNLDNK